MNDNTRSEDHPPRRPGGNRPEHGPLRVRRGHHRRRLRPDVSRAVHARHRPGHPRYLLPARARSTGCGGYSSPTATKTTSARSPSSCRNFPRPIYGTALTLGFVREKLKEYDLDEVAELQVVKPREKVAVGAFEVEFIRVAHSIVDGCGLAIRTPRGGGDPYRRFQARPDPGGRRTDRPRHLCPLRRGGGPGAHGRFHQCGAGGVHPLGKAGGRRLCTRSFPSCPGRIIVAAFSSNIHRVQQVVDAAAACGRKVLLNGRSMIANVQIARELGYLNIPDEHTDRPEGTAPPPQGRGLHDHHRLPGRADERPDPHRHGRSQADQAGERGHRHPLLPVHSRATKRPSPT